VEHAISPLLPRQSFLNRTEENGKPIFWSRGNGWVFAGLAMVLDILPANDPRREFYLDRYREMAAEVISIQGQDGSVTSG
jgi:unsaturated rhamnogalacturonyl hydrolase